MATKKKPAGDPAELSTFGVLSRLDHDGVTYEAGSTVELTEDQAEVLLPLGVIAPADGGEPKA